MCGVLKRPYQIYIERGDALLFHERSGILDVNENIHEEIANLLLKLEENEIITINANNLKPK
jgi:hypothetical protein